LLIGYKVKNIFIYSFSDSGNRAHEDNMQKEERQRQRVNTNYNTICNNERLKVTEKAVILSRGETGNLLFLFPFLHTVIRIVYNLSTLLMVIYVFFNF